MTKKEITAIAIAYIFLNLFFALVSQRFFRFFVTAVIANLFEFGLFFFLARIIKDRFE